MRAGGHARLVIFAGQSNMVGHVKATDGAKPLNPHVRAWTGLEHGGAWRQAELGHPPFNIKPGAPNNPALHFADALQRETGDAVLLIGRPINGSTLESWRRPEAENMSALLRDVAAALETDEARQAGLRQADYLLWTQGESDDAGATMIKTPKADTLESYAAGFAEMARSLAAQEWWEAETLLIACPMVEDGWLSARNDFYADPTYWPDTIRMRAISSTGLGHVGDRAHYDGAALAEIGRRMVEAR